MHGAQRVPLRSGGQWESRQVNVGRVHRTGDPRKENYTGRELQRSAGIPPAFKRVLISVHSKETIQSQGKNHPEASYF